MAESQHTSDLYDVHEGDTVTLHTTEGETFHDVECAMREVHHSEQRHEHRGPIAETVLWSFDVDGDDLTAAIVDGIESSEDAPDFPDHKEAHLGTIGKADGWTPMGFIETVEIESE